MKRTFTLSLIVLSLFTPSLFADSDKIDNTAALGQLPEIIREGFNSWFEGNKTQAINSWNDHFIPTGKGENISDKMRDDFTTITKEYSSPERIEIVYVREVTPAFKQYYVLFGFARGIIFFRFDAYMTADGLKLYDVRFSANPDKILPPIQENI